MPQRLLRPAIRQSKRWNRLSWIAQTFYIRLITLVDDFGRYEADHELLRSEVFPYGDQKGEMVPVPTIADICQQLSASEMVVFYVFDGKNYLQLTRWQERTRSESKFPDPKKGDLRTFDSKCQQMTASPPSPSPSPSPAPTPERVQMSVKRPAGDLNVFENLRSRISEMYGKTRRWNNIEETTLADIAREPTALQEFEAIKEYRSRLPAKEKKYFPQSVLSLLEKWPELLDRGRALPHLNGSRRPDPVEQAERL